VLQPSYLTKLIFGSLPLRCWTWIWRAFRGASPTCRPPQNKSPTVRTQLAASLDPRNLEVLHLHPLFLARHTAIRSTDRIWLCNLLYDLERSTTECLALEHPPHSRGYRQKRRSKPLLRSPQALESCKPDNGRCSQGRGRIHTDAHDDH